MNKIYLSLLLLGVTILSAASASEEFLSDEETLSRQLFTFNNTIGASSTYRCTADSTCFSAGSTYNLTSCCGKWYRSGTLSSAYNYCVPLIFTNSWFIYNSYNFTVTCYSPTTNNQKLLPANCTTNNDCSSS